MKSDVDFVFKVSLIGNSGVGKSSLMNQIANGRFDETYISTIGVDFRFKNIRYNDKIVKLQIWDTAGQERFRSIVGAYYRNANGIFVVFDITNRDTFETCTYWIDEIKKYASEDVVIFLIGNKSDLDYYRTITFEEASNFAAIHKISYFETSAKDNIETNKIFDAITKTLVKKEITKKIQNDDIIPIDYTENKKYICC